MQVLTSLKTIRSDQMINVVISLRQPRRDGIPPCQSVLPKIPTTRKNAALPRVMKASLVPPTLKQGSNDPARRHWSIVSHQGNDNVVLQERMERDQKASALRFGIWPNVAQIKEANAHCCTHRQTYLSAQLLYKTTNYYEGNLATRLNKSYTNTLLYSLPKRRQSLLLLKAQGSRMVSSVGNPPPKTKARPRHRKRRGPPKRRDGAYKRDDVLGTCRSCIARRTDPMEH